MGDKDEGRYEDGINKALSESTRTPSDSEVEDDVERSTHPEVAPAHRCTCPSIKRCKTARERTQRPKNLKTAREGTQEPKTRELPATGSQKNGKGPKNPIIITAFLLLFHIPYLPKPA